MSQGSDDRPRPELDPSPATASNGAADQPREPFSEEGPERLSAEMDRLRKALSEKDAQIAKVMKAYRALKKETERVRRRVEHDQRQAITKSKSELIARFVDVLDNLDRAVDSIENNFDSDSVLQGILLLRSTLVQLLREEGLEKIFVDGQPFDPTHSEAAAIEPVPSESENNIVLRELQRGYRMKGSLLRPARVVVGRYAPSGAHDEDEPSPDSDDPESR